jgi:hypothetical protein
MLFTGAGQAAMLSVVLRPKEVSNWLIAGSIGGDYPATMPLCSNLAGTVMITSGAVPALLPTHIGVSQTR